MGRDSKIFLGLLGITIVLSLTYKSDTEFDGNTQGKDWGKDLPLSNRQKEMQQRINSGWRPYNNGPIIERSNRHHHHATEIDMSDPYIIDQLEDEYRK